MLYTTRGGHACAHWHAFASAASLAAHQVVDFLVYLCGATFTTMHCYVSASGSGILQSRLRCGCHTQCVLCWISWIALLFVFHQGHISHCSMRTLAAAVFTVSSCMWLSTSWCACPTQDTTSFQLGGGLVLEQLQSSATMNVIISSCVLPGGCMAGGH